MSIKNNDPNVDAALFVPQANENGLDLSKQNRITLGKYLSERTKGKQSDDKIFPSRKAQYNPPRSNAFPISETSDDLILNRDVLSQISSDQESFVTENDSAYKEWSTKGGPVSRDKIIRDDTSDIERHRVLNSVIGGHRADEILKLDQDPIEDPTSAVAGTINSLRSSETSKRLKSGISSVLRDNIYTRDSFFTAGKVSKNFEGDDFTSSLEKIAEMKKAAEDALFYSAGKNTVGHQINFAPANVRIGVDGMRVREGKGSIDLVGDIENGVDVDGSTFIPSHLINQNQASLKVDDGLGTTGGIYTGLSYGNKNSVDSPFGNLFKSGTTILSALAALLAIILAVLVWSAVVALIIQKLDRPDYRTGRLAPGSERDTTFGEDLLGMVFGTKKPYNVSTLAAAFQGTYLFLGISTSGADTGTIVGKALLNFAMSPDYYVMVSRSVLTGLYSFINSFSAGGGGVAGAMAILGAIRTNRLVTFVNRIIDVGSVTLRGVDITEETLEKPPSNPNDLAQYRDSAIRRVSRSRETGNKLSWRSSSTAMKLLMPGSMIRGAALLYSDEKNLQKIWVDRIAGRVPLAGSGGKSVTDDGYFDQESIKEVEKALDAEYVPFYFRDLRTNEIISFHAFLEDLSDSFTANYTAAEGFGRQDPVQMYKNTTRSIGFSFYVVSTSPKDHDVMWYKINKLVTMLYPQYTDGKLASNVDNKNQFEVPFSQVYGSSPLIRLRVGDVIASNYSRFGLARLFGLGKKDRTFHITKDEDSAEPQIANDQFEKVKKSLTDGGEVNSAYFERIKDSSTDGSPKLSSDMNPFSGAVAGRIIRGGVYVGFKDKPSSILKPTYRVHLRPNTQVKFLKIDETFESNHLTLLGSASGRKNVAFCELVTPVNPSASQAADPSPPKGADASKEKEPDQVKYVAVPWELLETNVDIENDGSELIPVIFLPSTEKSPPAPDAGKIKNIGDFFSNNNAIVRSFESSMGYGLAGVLTSMAMDWNESTWETDRLGSKAPIFLKITMQFAPIHDLPMGLDSQGAMVAPAYPVGDLTRGSHGISRVKQDGTYETTLGESKPAGGENPKNTVTAPYKKNFI
jgi:hypothetical protein